MQCCWCFTYILQAGASLPAAHGCRETCSAVWHVDVCVCVCVRLSLQGSTTAVANPCLQYACLLKVIWWCKDSVHLPSLGNVSCRCVCVSMLLSGYVKCNVGFFIPCLMSWQSVILRVKRDRMIHQNNACLAVSLPQGGCAWLQYPFQQCVPLDCCIWEMNELHSSEKHPTFCITSTLLKTLLTFV